MTARTPLQQLTCSCLSTDSRRCYEIRHPAPMDDLERSYYFEQLQEDDSHCECLCHNAEYPEDYFDE